MCVCHMFNKVLTYLLTYLHYTMCSYWDTWRNVLPLDCIEKCAPIDLHAKCAPDSEISEFSFTSTAKYTLVELRNDICIRFHFLAKSAPILYSEHVCSY